VERSLAPIEQAEIRRRGWLNIVGAPSTWLPLGAGVVLLALAGSWMGGLAWLGWAALAAGIGWAGWRLTAGRRQVDRAAAEQLRRKLSHEHREYLRDLRRQVRSDDDGRTTQLIRGLGESFDRLVQQRMFERAEEPQWHAEVREKMASLYRSAVIWVERSIELGAAQQRVRSPEAQQRLARERNELLGEIHTSVQQLDQSLDALQLQQLDRDLPPQTLGQVRADLDRGLEVARRVDERLEALEREVGGRQRE
jgi:hypothetical protein